MFKLPDLPYSYDALEPHFDARTMEIHHAKHHATYVNKLNEALEQAPDWQNKSIEEILTNLSIIPEVVRTAVRNHGGGHYNHSLFWTSLSPELSQPSADLTAQLTQGFGSLDNFKEQFSKAAGGLFGSGWAWLVKNQSNQLSIITTPNQDTPISQGLQPILGLDVWEHAYYLKFQNRRLEYIAAWWNLVNWSEVARRLSL